jgi:phospholipid transport system substrate-binding protein
MAVAPENERKSMRHLKNLIRLLSFFGLIVSASHSGAGEPTVQLSETINEFVQILASTPAGELRTKGLPEKALTLVFNRFDFTEMAKRSLGRHWNTLGASERREFVQAFTQKLLNAYGRTVRATGDEKIAYERETTDGKYSSVETRVSSSAGETAIGYRLHAVEGQWKVYDVVIENVSIVNNYRAQFDRVIAKSSVQELLQKIKQQDS